MGQVAASRPTRFRSPAAFRAWLAKHQDGRAELIVRCYKVHAREKGITYKQALDEALCFGWIDGVRRSLDVDSFSVRFAPRKPRSIWSRVNIARARELEAEGRMTPRGLVAFRAREEARSGVYSFESRPVALAPPFERRLRANRRAWEFFQSQPPWYRRTCAFWVMSAKREETRASRLEVLIAYSARGTPVPPLARTPRQAPARARPAKSPSAPRRAAGERQPAR